MTTTATLTTRSSWKQHLLPLLIIVAVVMAANGMYLSGRADPSAVGWTSSITTNVCHLECSAPTMDPNAGYVTQALGHRAALDLLHGNIPWWNPYEGVGSPLAGETQSAALFPTVLLFLLPSGLLWFHVFFELLAGFATYFLARRLGLSRLIACVAGALFCVNGTFAWVGNAPVNPIAFLPLTLLLVERIVNPTTTKPKVPNWALLGVVLALTWYSGFPEVMYLDGLFIAGWAVLRLCQSGVLQRRTKAASLIVGSAVGVFLAAPGIIALKDYLHVGYVGSHVASVAGTTSLSAASAPMLLTPYAYGGIYSNGFLTTSWDAATGYFTTALLALALYGLFNRRSRPLKLYLAGWTVAGLLGAFGLLYVHHIWNVIPLVASSWLLRYIFPSCEFAMVILAVLGLRDLLGPSKRTRLLLACVLSLAAAVGGLLYTGSRMDGFLLPHIEEVVRLVTSVGFLAGLLVIMAAALVAKPKTMVIIASVLLVLESLVLFIAPTFSSPSSTTVDQAPITFLLKHQGLHRFLSLGPIAPNWGSYFGLYELSMIDLPVPKNWAHYVTHVLTPGTVVPPNKFIVQASSDPYLLDKELEQVSYYLTNYEQSGVKYLVLDSPASMPTTLRSQGVIQVYHDKMVTIYQLPHPAPFFKTSSPCTVRAVSVNKAQLSCPASTSLTRLELYMPGWHATVNGHAVKIHEKKGVFQEVSVPKGNSTVEFTFLPPHEHLGVGLAVVGVVAVLSSPFWRRRKRRAPGLVANEAPASQS
jgi:hypothetical protein